MFADDEFLKNGYKIQLTNNSNIYGAPNLLCEYVITHGKGLVNADIFINRSLSEDFLLFFSYEYDTNVRIKYSITYSITGISMNSASFLFYSNKSFETSPFVIYFKSVEPDESEVLTYLFLAATIGFVALAIVGIILVRKCSIFFNLKKNNKKNNETYNSKYHYHKEKINSENNNINNNKINKKKMNYKISYDKDLKPEEIKRKGKEPDYQYSYYKGNIERTPSEGNINERFD